MRRLAQPADLEPVFAIYSHPKVVPYLTYDPMGIETFVPIFEELLSSGCFWIWEVERTGSGIGDGVDAGGQGSRAIGGFYRATRYPGRVQHVLQLGTLAVAPQLHGLGIGRAMIDDALQHFRAEGVRRVELYAESDNTQALAFYQRLGFVHEGTLREFYKRSDEAHYVDEYVLGLLLA